MRTGQYYLNKGGPYTEFFPEVLAARRGPGLRRLRVPPRADEQEHIDEIPALVSDHGVTSFKIFMFYGGHGLHGRSTDQNSFLMIPEGERYDYAHFEFVMRGIQAAREKFPELADEISLSLHCETAEIMTAYTKLVEEAGQLTGLAAYSASRPPHSEGLAVTHRVVPRPRDRAAEHQPAAPVVGARPSTRRCGWRRRSRTSTSAAR